MTELASPQRSIRDFFISPQKEVSVTKKQKDILGYFGTTYHKQNNSSPVTLERKFPAKSVDAWKPTKKRKKGDDLDASLEDFDTEQKQPGKKRKKNPTTDCEHEVRNRKENTTGKTSKKKNQEGRSIPKSAVNGLVKKDCEGKTQTCKETESSNELNSHELQQTSGVTDPSPRSDIDLKEHRHDSHSNLPISDNCVKIDGEEKDGCVKEGSTLQTSTDGEVAEMCYEDFLESLNADSTADSPVNAANSEKDDLCKENDNEVDDSVKQDNYPSVANFFTKIAKADVVVKNIDPKTQSLVTIKAVVHDKPVKQEEVDDKVNVTSPRPLTSNLGDEIEILGSEVIEIEEITPVPVSKKKLFNEDTEKILSGNMSATVISEDSCMSEDSSICVVEEVEDSTQLEKKKSFLQSTSLPDVSSKTKQGTLSMFHVGHGQVKSMKNSKNVQAVSKKGSSAHSKCTEGDTDDEPGKKKPGRKPGVKKSKAKLETEKVVNTPKQKPSKQRRKNHVEESVDQDKTEDCGSERRRTLRSRYKISLLEAQGGQNSPIRMKILRYNKSSSSGTDDGSNSTPKSSKHDAVKKNKMSKAKELLDKAKSKKKGKKSKHKERKVNKSKTKEKADGKSSGRRRSARLSGKHSPGEYEDDVVIDLESDEEGDNAKSTKTPRKSRGKATPLKGRATPSKKTGASKPRNTPSKKGTKPLASIFTKGKPESKQAVVLDPEAERLKRAFLMSGVPEELKRQTSAVNSVPLEDAPCFPLDSHIQQRDVIVCRGSDVSLWDLPDVSLPYCNQLPTLKNDVVAWQKGFICSQEDGTDYSTIKEFKRHEKIEDAVIEKILCEISSICPSFPVKKIFNILKDKKDEYEPVPEDKAKDRQSDKKTDQGSKDEGQDGKKGKKAVRRSLRRKRVSVELPDVIELGASPEPANTDSSVDNKGDVVPLLNLTEKYAPVHSSEVLGNSGKIKKLRSWLMEWKHLLDREARKARKLAMKQNKGKSSKASNEDNGWWSKDDSDFDFDSEDETEDEDCLCNTVMLMGPSGIGKTATVYALAQEFGFKIFEVNASSSRNGKKILAQLQEATQSHQVSQNKDSAQQSLKFPATPSSSSCSLPQNKKVPAAFSNFFKPSTPSKGLSAKSMSTLLKSVKETTKQNILEDKKRKVEKSSDNKTPKKKRKQDKNGEQTRQNVIGDKMEEKNDNQGLNLSSTSLILFEEVDIVFESDQGFWAAVQQFMATTKIPIILTTSEPNLSSRFDGRFDLHKFKLPAFTSTTSYLQLVCLAEDMRTDYKDVYQLVESHNGDIRQSLLSLQYWIHSGGAVHPIKKNLPGKLLQPKDSTVEKVTAINNHVQISQKLVNEDEDDDDFVSIKPVSYRRPPRVLSDDESSNSMSVVLMPSTLPLDSVPQDECACVGEVKGENLPCVHTGCCQCLQQLPLQGCNNIFHLLQKMVETKEDSFVSVASLACQQYFDLQQNNSLYHNHVQLLPLRTVSTPSNPRAATKVTVKKQRKRIKQFDLYDSEASDGESTVVETQNDEQKEIKKLPLDPQESKMCNESLTAFFGYYDNMSLTDSLTALYSRSNALFDTVESASNLCSELQMYSFRNLYNTHKGMDRKCGASEVLCIPEQSVSTRLDRRHQRNDMPVSKCIENIRQNLPLNISSMDLNTDYVPTLRCVCKAEQIKKQSKNKRRFHHYLDNIGMPLKDTTLTILCTTFE